MYQVKKRNGDLEMFELSKIKSAITRTFEACGRNYQESIVETLAIKSVANAEKKIKDNVLSVEDIQDSVESILMGYGYEDVSKAYILYRKQHEKARNAKNSVLDYKKTMDGYLKASDWRVKENSSISYSLGGLILGNSGAMTANYWLSEIYDDEIANAHRNCDIHIHDLSMLSGYCFTGDTIVKSLDGKNRTFEQLVKDGVKELWVYSYDTDNNKVVIAKAENPRITRYVNELVEITLASGKKIRCTKDHPIMKRDGTYIKACDLKPNMSVMPLNISEKGRYVGINKFWTNIGRKTSVHRWVAEQVCGRPLNDNEVVHHINENKHDNRPENLEIMLDSEHRALEIRKTMETDVWKTNNNDRLVKFNKSDEKRASVSAFAKSRSRDASGKFIEFSYNKDLDTDGTAYNHTVRKVKIVELEENIPVYDLTVPIYHNFAVGGDIFVHNCAGWSLKALIKEGFNGVAKKTSSGPAKHLSTLCNQMTNFLGCLQNEWSGAQAFNSVDTLLAPFVKAENLSYKEVKQCIQSLIFNLNTSSRWGCVPDDTEVLTVDGFKKYNELKVGDLIYTWHDGTLEINDVKNVLIKEYSGKLQSYTGRGYDQTVTPEHHVLCKKFNKDEYVLKDSKDIFDVKTPYSLPVKFKSSALDSSDLTDAQIQLAAIVYADGTLDFRKGSIHKVKIFKSAKRFGNDLIKMCADELGLEYSVKSCKRGFSECLNTYTFYGNSARYIAELVGSKTKVHERFLTMSSDQSNLFLDTWMKFDGDTGRYMIQYDNDDIADALQHIALRSGCCTYLVSYDKKTNKKPTNYVSIRRVDTVCPTERTETDYNGIVWCPSVENGTAVFRRN